jgi:hypothetical protein
MSYPTDPEFQAIDVRLNYNNVKTQTRSGRTQVRNIGAALWSFTAKYNNLTRDEMAPVMAFLAGTSGGTSAFSIVPPVVSNSRGNATGTLRANGASAAGDKTIPMDGISGSVKAGDFIKFAQHSKVYMLVTDVTTSGTATIEPALHESVANNEIITYNSVPFTMRVARDVQRFQLSGFDQYQLEVDLLEAI